MLEPVVEAAMTELGQHVNHANALASNIDKAFAVHTLLKLHEAGYRRDVDKLCGWALSHGFTGAEEDRLRQYATKVLEGSPFRPLPTDPFSPGAVQRWPSQASCQRLIVALAAARATAIRRLTLDDLDLPNRRIIIAGHPQRLGELPHQRLLAWLAQRRITWPKTPNRHVLINAKTALGTGPVSAEYLKRHLLHQGVYLERIRGDRVLHEPLTVGADPLHLTLFSVPHRREPLRGNKLVVLYSKPADPDHFRDYYVTNHLPLVMNGPACLRGAAASTWRRPREKRRISRSSKATSLTPPPWPRRGRRRKASGSPPMSPTTPPAVRSSSTIRCRTAPAEAGRYAPGRVTELARMMIERFLDAAHRCVWVAA